MTAGSGAEVTKGAIITDTKAKLKTGIRGEVLFPKVAIVDPELTLTMPPKVTAETGFDALTHAIESYVAKKASTITDVYSEKAIELIANNLERAIKDGSDIEAREKMSFASLLSGANIANASSCLPHRLQQALGSVVECSHGGGLAMVYPSWIRHAYPYAKEKFDNIAKMFGQTDCEKAIIDLIKRVNIDPRLRDLGVQKNQIQEFVDKVNGNLSNDPMPLEMIDKKLIKKIYEESF
jgi:alcohol dehydrogenase